MLLAGGQLLAGRQPPGSSRGSLVPACPGHTGKIAKIAKTRMGAGPGDGRAERAACRAQS